MDADTARRRLTEARIGRLATATSEGRPHVVPCCFAVVGDTVYTAVDAKPKSTTALRRVTNIESNPRASLLVDHYAEDWSALWWVRVDGGVRLMTTPPAQARDALLAKYPQYHHVAITGPVIAIAIDTWRSWP